MKDGDPKKQRTVQFVSVGPKRTPRPPRPEKQQAPKTVKAGRAPKSVSLSAPKRGGAPRQGRPSGSCRAMVRKLGT